MNNLEKRVNNRIKLKIKGEEVKKKLRLLAILTFILFILTGCDQAENKDNSYLKEKNKAELEYLESKIVKISNGISFGEFIQTNEESAIQENTTDKSSDMQSSSDSQNQTSSDSNTSDDSTSKNTTQGNTATANTTLDETEFQKQNAGVLLPADQNQELNWEEVSQDLEDVYSAWTVVTGDLLNLKISDEDLIGFGNQLDNATIAVGNKDKKTILYEMANLSKYLAKFIAMYNQDASENTEKQIKASIISSLAYAENGDWTNSGNELGYAESEHIKLMNQDDYVKQNTYLVNKRSILISELKNAITMQNLELYHLKYKYLIEEF